MATVLQLRKRLEVQPAGWLVEGVSLRHYRDGADADRWLELRQRAFAREKIGVRQWSRGEFEAELIGRAWWQPERMWLAEAESAEGLLTVGSVTLAERGGGTNARPAVHWLMVLPRWRRRGIGRQLIAALESFVWNSGQREIWLETHAGWEAATAFYEKLGYKPVHAA